LPGDEFHDEVENVVRISDIVDVGNVGMVQLGDGAGLLDEHVSKSLLRCQLVGNDLDRDFAFEGNIPSLEHASHGPCA
jgi:hypothetical protein